MVRCWDDYCRTSWKLSQNEHLEGVLNSVQCSIFFLKLCNYPHNYICLLFTISTIMEVQWLFYKVKQQPKQEHHNETMQFQGYFLSRTPLKIDAILHATSTWFNSSTNEPNIFTISPQSYHFSPISQKFWWQKTKITENIAHCKDNFQINSGKVNVS